MNEVLDGLLGAVQNVDPVLRTLLAALAMVCETSLLIGLIVPGDSIVIVASTAVQGVGEWIALYVAVVVGSLAGESLGFAIGRWAGHRLRHSRLGRRLGERNWTRAEVYLRRRGGPAIAVSRFLPILHALIPVTVGMSPMSYRRFIAWSAPACALWAALYVAVGSGAAGSYRQLSASLHGAAYVFAGVIALFVILAIVARRLLHRAELRHMDAAADDENVPSSGA